MHVVNVKLYNCICCISIIHFVKAAKWAHLGYLYGIEIMLSRLDVCLRMFHTMCISDFMGVCGHFFLRNLVCAWSRADVIDVRIK